MLKIVVSFFVVVLKIVVSFFVVVLKTVVFEIIKHSLKNI